MYGHIWSYTLTEKGIECYIFIRQLYGNTSVLIRFFQQLKNTNISVFYDLDYNIHVKGVSMLWYIPWTGFCISISYLINTSYNTQAVSIYWVQIYSCKIFFQVLCTVWFIKRISSVWTFDVVKLFIHLVGNIFIALKGFYILKNQESPSEDALNVIVMTGHNTLALYCPKICTAGHSLIKAYAHSFMQAFISETVLFTNSTTVESVTNK